MDAPPPATPAVASPKRVGHAWRIRLAYFAILAVLVVMALAGLAQLDRAWGVSRTEAHVVADAGRLRALGTEASRRTLFAIDDGSSHAFDAAREAVGEWVAHERYVRQMLESRCAELADTCERLDAVERRMADAKATMERLLQTPAAGRAAERGSVQTL